jgi:uncharacterized protein (DUF3820 family)
MEMPFGKFKGQPLAGIPADYLVWLVSRADIRHNHWPLIEGGILAELRRRLEQWDDLVADLRVAELPEYWKTPKRAAQQAADRREKLRQLEERRWQALREDTRKRTAWQLARRYNVPSGTMTADQILEAWRAGTLPGQTNAPPSNNDFSDLV